MGKNDTCNNKTSDAFDFYCYSCDPDDNNIEGNQKADKSDGIIGDNDYDYDIDEDDWEDDWEDEWESYLDDALDDYNFYY